MWSIKRKVQRSGGQRLTMKIYSKTDIGKTRSSNQDAVKTGKISDSLAWSVVCDGMGGVAGGDVASDIAVLTISSYLNKELSANKNSKEIKNVVYEAVNSANKAIYLKSQNDVSLKNMGTTVILCVLNGDDLHVVHVGDSRAYLIDENNINQITIDHSMVQEMLSSGKITVDEAKNHPQKNVITRALGVSEEVEIDYNHLKIKQGNIVMLCTDGLTNHVDESRIHEICKENDLSQVPQILIDEGNKNGGSDNITVSVIEY